MQKTAMYLVIAILIVSVVGYAIYFVTNANKNQNPKAIDNGNNQIVEDPYEITKDGFTLKYTILSDNEIEYSLKGKLPTPCHRINDDFFIKESYPEQVTFKVAIVEPKKDEVCAQVITPVEVTGKLEVSKEAKFDIVVEK